MNISDKKRPATKLFEKNIARLFFKNSTELLPGEYRVQVDLPIRDVVFENQKFSIHSWFIPAEPAGGTVLFIPGSTGTVRSWLLLFHYLHRKGMNIWTFDYPGYGKSQGKITFSTFFYDTRFALRSILAHEWFQNRNVVLYGHSLGCFAAQEFFHVAEFHPTRIILQSPIYSLSQLLRNRVPFFLQRLLGLDRFRLNELFESDFFLTIFIGEQDPLIPQEEREMWKKRKNTHVQIFPDYKHASFINPKPAMLDPYFNFNA